MHCVQLRERPGFEPISKLTWALKQSYETIYQNNALQTRECAIEARRRGGNAAHQRQQSRTSGIEVIETETDVMPRRFVAGENEGFSCG